MWELAAYPMIDLVLAYLVWHVTSLGRLGALVYGYLTFGMYVVLASIYLLWDGETALTVTPLYVSLGVFHVTALVPVLAYLQPARQKMVFRTSLWELLLSSD